MQNENERKILKKREEKKSFITQLRAKELTNEVKVVKKVQETKRRKITSNIDK
jgi:hypothetical protein